MEIMKSYGPSYTRLIGASYPGLIMILLDQSLSMKEHGKAIEAAKATNRVIYEIMLASRSEGEIIDRCFVGVIGYGKSIKPIVGDKISQVAATPLRIESVEKMVSDRAGGLVSAKIEMPIWVEPEFQNGTPMAETFEKAYTLIEGWIRDNPNSFPPIVMNITDGEPNDFDKSTGNALKTKDMATRLMDLETTDGKVLLFNAHISGLVSANELQLPSSESGIVDPYAKMLFNISSILPPRLIEEAKKVGLSTQAGSRGLVFNANAETLIKLLTFGSSVAR